MKWFYLLLYPIGLRTISQTTLGRSPVFFMNKHDSNYLAIILIIQQTKSSNPNRKKFVIERYGMFIISTIYHHWLYIT